ncbi:T9SS type A sorting domain-containing protein [Aquimarina sp. RZ0]|uniref:T9SS type A sorting domain-containing protein n=1 Tax=Aquimarina sp. RZ0 TaxID=2607730 RepID=UPI00165F3A78|nr:T9SS type A sorting domain-containing protein [Aquimarina sp. RZ0]
MSLLSSTTLLAQEKKATTATLNKENTHGSIPLCGTPTSDLYTKIHQKKVQSKIHKTRNKKPPVLIEEIENGEQSINNTISTAQKIPNFGNGENQISEVSIKGSIGVDLMYEFIPKVVQEDPEDNGSIPLAQNLPFDTDLPEDQIQFITVSGVIGDGPHSASGTGTGDFDMFSVKLEKEQLIRMTVAAPQSDTTNLNPVIAIRNESGEQLDIEGNVRRRTPDADGNFVTEIIFKSPENGTYFLEIAPAKYRLTDPFDPASGVIRFQSLPVDEGSYTANITNFGVLGDTDHYAIELKKGDVLGIASKDFQDTHSRINLFLPDGTLGIGTNSSTNDSNAPESPVPTNGESSFTYIAPQTGTYTLKFEESLGAYEAEIIAARPGFETNNKGLRQFIYLDFTGVDDFTYREFFNVSESDAPLNHPFYDTVRTFSPFRDFLENWSIENTRSNLLKMAFKITEVVKENTVNEVRLSEINPDYSLSILSDYGSETLGKKIPEILEKLDIPYSRVIIGGTREESGIRTVGLANDIDPGNYNLENDAFVLLSELSSTDERNRTSINFIPLADGFTIEDVMPVVLGNLVCHEFGHYLGNFHCNTFNDHITLMDEGGAGVSRLAGIFLNRGEKFGDTNTRDIDFTADEYSTSEDLRGEDLIDINTAFALGFTPGSRFEAIETPKEIEQLEENALKELFNEIDNLEAFAYPNPQNHQETSNLVFSSKKSGQVYVDLYDLQGRKIDQLFTGTIEKGEKIQLELVPSKYNLSSGVYIYNIKTPGQEINYKFSIK